MPLLRGDADPERVADNPEAPHLEPLTDRCADRRGIACDASLRGDAGPDPVADNPEAPQLEPLTDRCAHGWRRHRAIVSERQEGAFRRLRIVEHVRNLGGLGAFLVAAGAAVSVAVAFTAAGNLASNQPAVEHPILLRLGRLAAIFHVVQHAKRRLR